MKQELINELRTTIQKDYSKNLSEKDVLVIAETLVETYDLLAKINYQKNNKN